MLFRAFKWLKGLFTKVQDLENDKPLFTETPLERIERLKMGISLEDAEKEAEREKETPLEKIHRLRAEKAKPEPGPKIEYIDTSKIGKSDLITFTKQNN